MPCGDITEKIRLSIDNDERIVSYQFSKITCGGSIGGDLPLGQPLIGTRLDSIMEMTEGSDRLSGISSSDMNEFIKIKQIRTIKHVIKVYLGREAGGIDNQCTIAGIEYDDQGVTIDAQIKMSLDAGKVQACDHCGPG